MGEEDLRLDGTFKIAEGAEYFIVHSPDNAKHYVTHNQSTGFPVKILELHSKDNERAVATVFSFKLGMRFLIIFNIEDVRAV